MITEYGKLQYKRYIYKYLNEETNEIEYTSLVDQHYFLKKGDRLSAVLKLDMFNEIGEGINYDIITDKLFKYTNFSKMTITNIFKELKDEKIGFNKIFLSKNQRLNINVDDCYVKCFENGNKVKKMIRVISFNTGYNKSKSTNKRKVLENKRITYLIKNENEKFNVSELAEYVRKIGNIYFDNFNEADIVLGGDGST